MIVMFDYSSPGDLRQFLKSSRNLRLPAEPHWYSQNGPSDLQCPQDALSGPLQCHQSERSDPLHPQNKPSDPIQYPQSEPSDPVQYLQSVPAPKPLREVGALDHFGMTAKKSHEVKRMADMVYHLARNRGAQQVGNYTATYIYTSNVYAVLSFDCMLLL